MDSTATVLERGEGPPVIYTPKYQTLQAVGVWVHCQC